MMKGGGGLSIVSGYALTWQLLWQYDEDSLAISKREGGTSNLLAFDKVRQTIAILKQYLMDKKEASEIVGQEQGDALVGILGAIQQTFGGKDLYVTLDGKGR